MLGLALVALFTQHFYSGTISYEDCLKDDFKPKACYQARSMNNMGREACKLQGKGYDNSNCVSVAQKNP